MSFIPDCSYFKKQINVTIDVVICQLSNSLPEDMKEMIPEPEVIVRRLRIFEGEQITDLFDWIVPVCILS